MRVCNKQLHVCRFKHRCIATTLLLSLQIREAFCSDENNFTPVAVINCPPPVCRDKTVRRCSYKINEIHIVQLMSSIHLVCLVLSVRIVRYPPRTGHCPISILHRSLPNIHLAQVTAQYPPRTGHCPISILHSQCPTLPSYK